MTPKRSLLVILVVLVAVAATRERPDRILPPLLASLAVAAAIDLPLLRLRHGRWTVPDGGLITALLVAMITSPYDPWHLAPTTTAIALASKHLLRWRGVNLLNPAAVGLVVSYVALDAAHSWWGALPDIAPAVGWPLLVLTGGYMVDRVNRIPLALAFLATYFTLFTALAFVRDRTTVAEIFVTPDLQAAVFFAAFMLTDPPTSPPRWRAQAACGITVAVSAAVLFVTTGGAFYLLGALLVGNVLFVRGWRRAS